ncbi:hypothetical protein CU098_005051 [Rhizopus stolonifer]|uniref:Uncharacterized protein n=1 Tax=Rhizopus stolonifer TaxID=4846 RepID=A0A367JZV8_RHIST|nr:hypothetical protein CU098_005051 [Rhizopus stolonifer]
MDVQTVSYSKKLKYVSFNNELLPSKNNTWSGAYLNSQEPKRHRINITEIESNFFMNFLPIEERISYYEKEYETCMESQTQLSAWIKSIKDKGPPRFLKEASARPSRSRFSDIFFMKNKRKSYLSYEATEATPTVKSSLSTFLKKATESLSTSCKQVPSLKRHSQKKMPSPSVSYQRHFSLKGFSRTKPQQSLSLCPLKNKAGSTPNDVSSTSKRLSSALSRKKPLPCFDIGSNVSLSSSPFLESTDCDRLEESNRYQIIQTNVPSSKLQTLQSIHSSIGASDDDMAVSSPSFESIHLAASPVSSSPKHANVLANEKSIFLKKAKQVHLDTVCQEQKKKRSSLLTAPSLSTLKILSQKSQLLKRQSMVT